MSTASNTILASRSNWDVWYAYIRDHAESLNVWTLIDPYKDEDPILQDPPTRPLPSDIKPTAYSFSDLDREELHRYQQLYCVYKNDKEDYQTERNGLNKIRQHLQNTVPSDDYIPLASRTPRLSVWAIMRHLKAEFCPSSEERLQDVATKDISFENLTNRFYKHYRRVGTDPRPPAWSAAYQATLNGQGPDTSNGLNNSSNNGARQSRRRGGSSRPPRPCVCGQTHRFSECPYLIVQRRPSEWKEDLETTRQIIDLLPTLPSSVHRAIEMARKDAAKSAGLQPNQGSNPIC